LNDEKIENLNESNDNDDIIKFDCKDSTKLPSNIATIKYKKVKNSSNNSRSASSDDIYIDCGDNKKDANRSKKRIM
jgi:hypothetical protein